MTEIKKAIELVAKEHEYNEIVQKALDALIHILEMEPRDDDY